MIQIPPLYDYLIALTFSVVPAWYLHEGTHWFIGWLENTDPKIRYENWIIPVQVEHGNIETIEPGEIRLLGLGIFLWLPVQFLAFGYLLFDFTTAHLFLAMVPFYIVFGCSSNSDRLAIRDPERYRQLEIEDNLPKGPLFYTALKNWIRS